MASSFPTFTPEHTFEAELELDSESGGVVVAVPFDAKEVYDVRGPVKVLVTFDGFPYRGAVVGLKDGRSGIVVPKTVRGAINKTWGNTVVVTLARDTEPLMVEVSDDFAKALANAGARHRFDEMSYEHQREYTRWIEAAKNSETRAERLRKAAQMIAAGRKRS